MVFGSVVLCGGLPKEVVWRLLVIVTFNSVKA
jgi:hypothetical protein